jgi:hypothetical protein
MDVGFGGGAKGEPEDVEMRSAGRINRMCADWGSVI